MTLGLSAQSFEDTEEYGEIVVQHLRFCEKSENQVGIKRAVNPVLGGEASCQETSSEK